MKVWDNPLPWILLLAAPLLDIAVGFAVGLLRRDFDWLRTPLIRLAAEKSRARTFYVVWLGLYGAALFLIAMTLLTSFLEVAAGWSATLTISLVGYAVFACLAPAFTRADGEVSFRRRKEKNVTAHRMTALFGQTLLLTADLSLAMLLFLSAMPALGVATLLLFAVAAAFYTFAVLGMRPRFAETRFALTGLWLRLFTIAAYLPFTLLAVALLVK